MITSIEHSSIPELHEKLLRVTQFSPCRKYRYTLWREFYSVRAIDPPLLPVEGNQAHNYLMIIGLNPSTADETVDDPTIRRCIGFAKAWGFGALCMTNLFAWRDTKPENMKRAIDPVGPENDRWLSECAAGAGLILAAWGKDGSFLNRSIAVQSSIHALWPERLKCLRRNADGSPGHPLYIPSATQMLKYP